MKRDLPEAEAMQRAYSVFNVKAIEDSGGFHVIKGMASTPRVDRVGDIVVPTGAHYALPIKLLLGHDSSEPVGNVVAAKKTKNGIEFEARIPKISEPGLVKDRVDQAIHELKYDLIGAVSIGFKAEKDGIEYIDDGGLQFNDWEWLELSLVTIPANPDARITSFKSFDDELRAALGAKQTAVARREKSSPGASGQMAVSIRSKKVATIKESIKDFESSRAAKVAELEGIQQKALGEGRTKDAAEKEKFDALAQEIKQIDAELVDLKDMDALNVVKAAAIPSHAGTDPVAAANSRVPAGSGVRVHANVEPGVRFARMAQALARAKYMQRGGFFQSPDEIAKADKRWMDSTPEVHLALKSAVAGGDSTTSGWASEWAYAQNIAAEFIEVLRPKTLLGKISGWRNVPFNIRVGGMSSGTTGYWVGEGVGINVSKGVSTSTTLGITKVGALSVITKELAMLSTPSAEMMIRNDLVSECQETADAALIDPNNGGSTNVKPASLTYGATARQASGTDYAAFKADWKAITSSFYAANISLSGAVVIMKEELAEALALMVTSLGNPQFPGLSATGGTLLGRPVFTTQIADTSGSPDFDNLLILLQPNEVFLADDGGATVEASDQVSVHMDDATTMKSTATATSTSTVSMFQTESIAIKAVRHVNWTKARSQACQYIRSAQYV
jgi:HK97 family phage major capsid protein/HK97 family phage prohead protease